MWKAIAHGALLGAVLVGTRAAQVSADGQGLGIANPGSPHNFADNVGVAEIGPTGWNKTEEICRPCHVPHDHNRAQDYAQNGLLWNHQVTQASYTMYSSPTLDGAIPSQPVGISKLCLGCHDGTVGIDVFEKYAGGRVYIDDYNVGFQMPGALYAGNLSRTHPISVVYDENADPGLKPKSAPMGTSGTIGDVLDGEGRVQCSSCHDIHDQAGEAVPGTHLLRVAQTAASGGTASGLCLTCHKK